MHGMMHSKLKKEIKCSNRKMKERRSGEELVM